MLQQKSLMMKAKTRRQKRQIKRYHKLIRDLDRIGDYRRIILNKKASIKIYVAYFFHLKTHKISQFLFHQWQYVYCKVFNYVGSLKNNRMHKKSWKKEKKRKNEEKKLNEPLKFVACNLNAEDIELRHDACIDLLEILNEMLKNDFYKEFLTYIRESTGIVKLVGSQMIDISDLHLIIDWVDFYSEESIQNDFMIFLEENKFNQRDVWNLLALLTSLKSEYFNPLPVFKTFRAYWKYLRRG